MNILSANDTRWESLVGTPVTVGDCLTSGCRRFKDYVSKVVRRDGHYMLHLYYTRLIQPTDVSNGWWVEPDKIDIL